MATRKSSIGAELVLDSRKFKAALNASQADARNYARNLEAMKAPRGGLFSPAAAQETAGGLQTVVAAGGKLIAAVAALKAASAIAGKAISANVWYADLKDKMTAVTGDADEAARHLGVLFAVSREQSMTREQTEVLVSMSERLQTLGYKSNQAADFLRELANTAEATGDSIEDTAGVVLALDKIGESGDNSLRKIMALSQEFPGLRRVLKDAFGTDTAKELQDLHLTSQELFDGLLHSMKKVKTSLPDAGEKGIGGTVAGWFGQDQNWDAALGADRKDQVALTERKALAETDETRDLRHAGFKNKAAAVKREAAEKARLESERELLNAEQMLILEREIARYTASGNDEMRRMYEDRLLLLTETVKMAKDLGLSEGVVEASLLKQQAVRRQTEEITRDAEKAAAAAEQAPGQGEARQQLEIDTLRSRGHIKKADKMQRALDIDSKAASLVKGGFKPEEAQRMAEQGQRATEDQAYFDRTGRHKVRAGENRLEADGFHSAPVDFTAFKRPLDNRSTIKGFDDETKPFTGPARAQIDEANAGIAAAIKAGNAAQLEELRAMKGALERLIGVSGGTVADKTRARNR